MIDRRSVLKLGAAGVAGAVVGMRGSLLEAAGTGTPSPLYRAVFDARVEEGVAFADELRRRGVTTSRIGVDLASLWYGDLQERLHHGPAPIAGLTDRATLFCLEELARGAGMKVLYRIDHLIDEHGQVEHDAAGPDAIVASARTLGRRSEFGRAMAVLASRIQLDERWDTAAVKRTGPFSPERKTALVSWVIA